LGATIEYILKITESAKPKPNKDSLRAMRDIEEGKNCDSFANANEMFQAYDFKVSDKNKKGRSECKQSR